MNLRFPLKAAEGAREYDSVVVFLEFGSSVFRQARRAAVETPR
jgi:hypothetical protein